LRQIVVKPELIGQPTSTIVAPLAAFRRVTAGPGMSWRLNSDEARHNCALALEATAKSGYQVTRGAVAWSGVFKSQGAVAGGPISKATAVRLSR
jgi:hypothetical protein